jgi:hypothetical protein
MNSRNDGMSGEAIVFALVLFIAYIIFAVVAALAIMLTVIFTVVALVAFANDGVTLFGEYTSRDEARAFFVRGYVGALLFPVFAALVLAILGLNIPIPYGWVAFAGYALGSVGGGIILASEEAEKAAQQTILPPLSEPEQYQPPALPQRTVTRQPFTFAEWKDEELFK